VTDLPDNVDLQWIGRQLLRIQGDIATIKDELLVTNARIDRVEASIQLLLTEMRAVRNLSARLDSRVTALEG
jgi:cob(I)alamin adenosyltransferase